MKAKIFCHAKDDCTTTAAKLLVMSGQMMVEPPPDATTESKEAARVFLEGVLGAAVDGGYAKCDILRAALASSQRSNRLSMMAHEACKAAGARALTNLIAGLPN
jgi:hypothetical protein